MTPTRISLLVGGAAYTRSATAEPAIAATASVMAALRQGAVKNRRTASRAPDPDICPIRLRLSNLARICSPLPSLCDACYALKRERSAFQRCSPTLCLNRIDFVSSLGVL